MDRVMVLGGGVYQVPLIRAVQRLGGEAFVVSPAGPYPGLSLADEVISTDTRDIDGVLLAARRIDPQGVVTTGTDAAIPSLGRTVEELGLIGVDSLTALRCSDKRLMREALESAGIPLAPGVVARSFAEARRSARELGYPVIVKPPDRSGSRGVLRVDTEEHLRDAVRAARSHTSAGAVLVERFLDGTEFGAQAFVVGAEVQATYLHDDLVFTGIHSVPIGHTMPCSLPTDLRETAEAVVEASIAALGIVDSAVNVDLMLEGGRIYVLEVACRAGATCLPELVSLLGGFNVYDELVSLATTGSADFTPRGTGRGAASGVLLTLPSSGIVTGIRGVEQAGPPTPTPIEDVVIDVGPGEEVHAFETGNHRVGHVVVSADDPLDALAGARTAAQSVRARIRVAQNLPDGPT